MIRRATLALAALAALAACGGGAPLPEPPPPPPPAQVAVPPPDPAPAPSGGAVQAVAEAPLPEPRGELDTLIDTLLDGGSDPARLRSPVLLETEMMQLRRLLEATPATAAEYPRILRRLADDAAELRASAEREARTAPDEAARRKAAARILPAARQSIDAYEALRARHPGFCQQRRAASPGEQGSGCNDEVLYFLGRELQHAGQLDDARKRYLELIQQFPASPYVAFAYFAFAEFFLARADATPADLEHARLAYDKVLQLQIERLTPAVLLRLGQVFDRQEKAGEARRHYQRLLLRHPDSPFARFVPAAARVAAP